MGRFCFITIIVYTRIMDISEQIKDIISKHTGVSELSDDDLLENSGLNSLDVVEISAEIEKIFNIEFTSEEIINIKTIKDIVCLIEQKRK